MNLSTLALMSGLGAGTQEANQQNFQDRLLNARYEQQSGLLGERLDMQAALKQAAIEAANSRATQSVNSKEKISGNNIDSRSNLSNNRFNFQDYMAHYKAANNFMGKAPGLDQTMSSQPYDVQKAFKDNQDRILGGLTATSPVPQQPPMVNPDLTAPVDPSAPPVALPDATQPTPDPTSAPSAPSTASAANLIAAGQPLVPQAAPVDPSNTAVAPSTMPVAPAPVASAPVIPTPDPNTPAPSALEPGGPPVDPNPAPVLTTPVDAAPVPTPAPVDGSLPGITNLLGLPGINPVSTAATQPTHDPDTDPKGVVPSATPTSIFNPDPFKVSKAANDTKRLDQAGRRIDQGDNRLDQQAAQFKQSQATTRRGQDLSAQSARDNREAATSRVGMQISAAMQRQQLGISDADFRDKYNQGQTNNREQMKNGGAGGVMDPVKYYKQLHGMESDQTSSLAGMASLTKPGKAAYQLTNKLDGTPLTDPKTGAPMMSTPLKPRIIIGADGNPDPSQSDPNAIPLYNQYKTRYRTAAAAQKSFEMPVPAATAQGDAIGDISSQLPGESQGAYVHRCQQRARVAYQQVTGAYNSYFGGSALSTLGNFQKAGLAQPFKSGQPLPPGSMLFSSKMGGDNGHVQVVGVGGTRFDQYGQNKFSLNNFDYFVPPPGQAKQTPQAQPKPQAQARTPRANSSVPSFSLTGIPPLNAGDAFK